MKRIPILYTLKTYLQTTLGMTTLALLVSTTLAQSKPNAFTIETFPVGSCPRGMVSDGVNLWVANLCDDTVSKLRASDGTLLGTFATGSPVSLAFDGANIWVTNVSADTVTKLRASDGALIGIYSVGFTRPHGIVFDGTNIWVVGDGDINKNVSELRGSDGTILASFDIGTAPARIAFDGSDVWITDQIDHTVTELRVSDGTILGVHSVSSA